jgi:hydroxymethylpyrimidine pyrophosphatase-like HAD family hydrolase
MDLKNKIIYFSDLDDTLFQTKRKSEEGVYKATNTNNNQKSSYYTKAQKRFLNHILLDKTSLLIPVTARTKLQFERTHLFQNKLTPVYANYYGGCITINGEISTEYENLIRPSLKIALEVSEKILSEYKNKSKKEIEIINVDQFYQVINSDSVKDFEYISNLFSKSETKFEIYKNEKTITILPSIINKKKAVEYLCKILDPRITIGLGDSKSDLDFLNICDFNVISKIGELNKIINGKY